MFHTELVRDTLICFYSKRHTICFQSILCYWSPYVKLRSQERLLERCSVLPTCGGDLARNGSSPLCCFLVKSDFCIVQAAESESRLRLYPDGCVFAGIGSNLETYRVRNV